LLVQILANVMDSTAYNVDGHAMILQPNSVPFLKTSGHSVSKINVSNTVEITRDKDILDDKFLAEYVEFSEADLMKLDTFTTSGLELLMGAVIITDKSRFRIICAEMYCRDPTVDPHAESLDIRPQSVPTEEPCTQYTGDLKVVRIHDNFKNWRLVIGVRSVNYLVTSGFKNNAAVVGPGRCASFEVNNRTRIFFARKRQNPDILASDVLGLAQLRSHFGSHTTYMTRRAALKGYSTLTDMPISIFSLSQYNVPFSRVFRSLADISKAKTDKIKLKITDIEKPKPHEKSSSASLTRKLLSLFPSDVEELMVTGNGEVEIALTNLANSFSRTISDRNLTVARTINNRNFPLV
ncbi:hypothetical protein BGZ76_004795, partial [Entomortierella beljakovae]